MQLAITLRHHDHAYVQRRGGWELLTHLRGAPARAEFRRQAIERAWLRFQAVELDGDGQSSIGGVGLVVLQRSLLAAEDLGGLLHGLSAPDPWQSLRSAKIPQMDAAFELAVTKPEDVLETSFRLVTEREVSEEELFPAEVAALMRLRDALMQRWQRMLLESARLWLSHRDVAKATMHGFPIVAAEHVFGPPPAGALAKAVGRAPQVPSVIAINSRLDDSEITTTPTVVPMSADAVGGYRRSGRVAARLYVEICEMQAGSAMSGHRASIPVGLISNIGEADARLIERAMERHARDAP